MIVKLLEEYNEISAFSTFLAIMWNAAQMPPHNAYGSHIMNLGSLPGRVPYYEGGR
jgi:hypothetical protein